MTELIEKLGNKSITTRELLQAAEQDWSLLPQLLNGVSSSKASIRYGCSKVLMGLSEAHPTKLYPFMGSIVDLLDSKYRIIIWNALAMIASLARVDKNKKFDAVFDKYYGFMNDEYMVTVANVAGNSGKIALAKPYLADKIADELVKVDSISLTPHLTEECKRVIAEKAIKSFDLFFDRITEKKKVISFVKRHASSPRQTLKAAAEDFLEKWS